MDLIFYGLLNYIKTQLMDQLIHCSKCQSIPYDVLMMNCNHNLCVKCAVERLQSQHTTKTAIGKSYLQCQKCKTKTNLDEESVRQLQQIQKTKGYVPKLYYDKDGQKRVQTPINTGRIKNKQKDKKEQKSINKNIIKNQAGNKNTSVPKKFGNQTNKQKQKQKIKQDSPGKQKEIQKIFNQIEKQQTIQTAPVVHRSVMEASYGQCEVHKEQPVMYYCFTCKIHCFCAQCVIIGKHNHHDVKVIKKAYQWIQKQFELAIKQTKRYISQLLQVNKQIANDINASKNKLDSIKKTIQKGFDEVRTIIREKELQFMKMVDQHYMKMMETNNGKVKKNVENSLHQQQELLKKLESTQKKGQKTILNFYGDEWNKIQQHLKHQEIKFPTLQSSFNQVLTEYTNAIRKQIVKIKPKSFSQ